MPHRIRLPIALCATILGTGLAVGGTTAASATVAHSAASCAGSTDSLRGGYFIQKQASHVSCATRRGLENGWQACRLKSGLSGRCHSKILGYSCHEGGRSTTKITFFANVSCTKGKAKFVYTYEQNKV